MPSRPEAGTATPALISPPVVIPAATPGAPATPAPSTLPPTPTPAGPSELTLCLLDEPTSLFLYARPEAGREHLLAPLYDGPLDQADFAYQPVLLQKLPSLADGDARVETVPVAEGKAVVDALGRVLPLAAGLQLAQADGTLLTHPGGAAQLPRLRVTFRLRPDVLWSDGQPLTADDSVFSFQLGLSPDVFNPRRDLAERTQGYTALDPQTVEWIGLPGYLDPLYYTPFWTPLPRHLFAGRTATEIADSPEANLRPLGWGPFVLSEWIPGQQAVFELSPNYFRAGEGLPRLRRLVYRFFPGRVDEALQALGRGECQLIPRSAGLESTQLLAAARALPGVVVHLAEGPVLEQITLGMVPAPEYQRASGGELLADARVRQALAVCLDREALRQADGLAGQIPAAYLPAVHPLRAADLAPATFDAARGRALWAEAGWGDADGDGVLDREGVPLRLSLAFGPEHDPRRARLAAEAARQLRENCGLEVDVRPLTRGEQEADWPDGVVFGRRFDLALFGWRVEATSPCRLFLAGEIPGAENPGGANAAGYASPAFEQACRRGLFPGDPSAEVEAQRQWAQDLASVPLFFRLRAALSRAEVQGYRLDASSASELMNLESVWLRP